MRGLCAVYIDLPAFRLYLFLTPQFSKVLHYHKISREQKRQTSMILPTTKSPISGVYLALSGFTLSSLLTFVTVPATVATILIPASSPSSATARYVPCPLIHCGSLVTTSPGVTIDVRPLPYCCGAPDIEMSPSMSASSSPSRKSPSKLGFGSSANLLVWICRGGGRMEIGILDYCCDMVDFRGCRVFLFLSDKVGALYRDAASVFCVYLSPTSLRYNPCPNNE